MSTDPKPALDPRVRAAYAALSPQRRDELARALARRHRAPSIARIERTGPGQLFALSPAQHRLWFLDQLRPGTTAYLVPLALELTGSLDPPALSSALDHLVARHEALRTTFPAQAGHPSARIGPAAPVPLRIVDVCEAAQPAAATDELRRAEVARPLDLANGPLLRATLVRTGAQTHQLLLTLHHIVADGWSLGLLVDELAALYQAEVSGEPARLSELTIDYVDFAAWQRGRLDGAGLANGVAGWRQALAGLPALALPADAAGPAAGVPHGGQLAIDWPADLIAATRELAAGHRATLFMVLLAALAATLARWSGQDDLVIGTPVAGRVVPEAEPVVGFFVNTIPLRVTVHGDPTFGELLARARDATLAGLARQDVPYERIAAVVRPSAGRAGAVAQPDPVPLVQVLLALRNVPARMPGPPGLELRVLPAPVGEAKFDLTWECGPGEDGGLHGRVEYAAHRYQEATVRRLHKSVTGLIAAAVQAPDARLSALTAGHPSMPTAPDGCAPAVSRGPREKPRTIAAPTPADQAVPPRDAVERLLAQVWGEVLEVDRVGALDDFFALGGHSLLVTAAVARVQEAVGFSVPLDGALGATTIRDFAGYLRTLSDAAGVDLDRVLSQGPSEAVPAGPRPLDRRRFRQ